MEKSIKPILEKGEIILVTPKIGSNTERAIYTDKRKNTIPNIIDKILYFDSTFKPNSNYEAALRIIGNYLANPQK